MTNKILALHPRYGEPVLVQPDVVIMHTDADYEVIENAYVGQILAALQQTPQPAEALARTVMPGLAPGQAFQLIDELVREHYLVEHCPEVS